jgi:hypothetical protein
VYRYRPDFVTEKIPVVLHEKCDEIKNRVLIKMSVGEISGSKATSVKVLVLWDAAQCSKN